MFLHETSFPFSHGPEELTDQISFSMFIDLACQKLILKDAGQAYIGRSIHSAAELRSRHRAKSESDEATICLSVCPSARLSVRLLCLFGISLVSLWYLFGICLVSYQRPTKQIPKGYQTDTKQISRGGPGGPGGLLGPLEV